MTVHKYCRTTNVIKPAGVPANKVYLILFMLYNFYKKLYNFLVDHGVNAKKACLFESQRHRGTEEPSKILPQSL